MNKQQIQSYLSTYFKPIYILVIDDSHNHAHHRGTHHTQNTHFEVTIVSEQFEGMSRLNRHRAIMNAMKSEFSNTLHALKITAKSPSEWND